MVRESERVCFETARKADMAEKVGDGVEDGRRGEFLGAAFEGEGGRRELGGRGQPGASFEWIRRGVNGVYAHHILTPVYFNPCHSTIAILF